MKTFVMLVITAILTCPIGLGDELGASFNWGDSTTAYAWAALSGELLGLSLTGRGELGLLPLRPRLLSLTGKLATDGLTLSAGGKLLGTGRLDLSGRLELAGGWTIGDSELSCRIALHTIWAAALSGGPVSTTLSASGKATAPIGWGEAKVELPLLGGLPRSQLAVGTGDASRVLSRLSFSGLHLSQVGLELGAGSDVTSGTVYFSLLPAGSATASIRIDLGGWELKLRLSLSPGRWGFSAEAATAVGELRLRARASFDREGFDKGTLELRLPWGD